MKKKHLDDSSYSTDKLTKSQISITFQKEETRYSRKECENFVKGYRKERARQEMVIFTFYNTLIHRINQRIKSNPLDI